MNETKLFQRTVLALFRCHDIQLVAMVTPVMVNKYYTCTSICKYSSTSSSCGHQVPGFHLEQAAFCLLGPDTLLLGPRHSDCSGHSVGWALDTLFVGRRPLWLSGPGHSVCRVLDTLIFVGPGTHCFLGPRQC